MKARHLPIQSERAFTLLEMTMVIGIMMLLIGTGFVVTNQMEEWKLGREASETLRSVYTAQRLFLADNPTQDISKLEEERLIPYIRGVPTNCTAKTFKELQDQKLLRVALSKEKATLSYIVTKSPPTFAIAGVAYDPSGSSTDSLWDVGQ